MVLFPAVIIECPDPAYGAPSRRAARAGLSYQGMMAKPATVAQAVQQLRVVEEGQRPTGGAMGHEARFSQLKHWGPGPARAVYGELGWLLVSTSSLRHVDMLTVEA